MKIMKLHLPSMSGEEVQEYSRALTEERDRANRELAIRAGWAKPVKTVSGWHVPKAEYLPETPAPVPQRTVAEAWWLWMVLGFSLGVVFSIILGTTLGW